MWMVDPRQMCRQHLLGEHNEIHKLVGTLHSRNIEIDGWVREQFVYPREIIARHAELVAEARRRGWPSGLDHETPIGPIDLSALPDVPIDRERNRRELAERCPRCRRRMRRSPG